MLADPVPALFRGREMLTDTKSIVHCEETLPTFSEAVSTSRRVPKFEETALHLMKVSDVQSVNSESEKQKRRRAVCRRFPNPIPKTDTVTEPVLALFAR